jgi:hypothetical protein
MTGPKYPGDPFARYPHPVPIEQPEPLPAAPF